jgi:hypothetical protein
VLVDFQKKRKTNEVRVSKSMKDLSKVRDREGSTKVDGASSENDTVCLMIPFKRIELDFTLSNVY